MQLKDRPEYVTFDPNNIQPLPQYGHLSKPHPEYEATKSAIDAAYAEFWKQPDWPAFRAAAGDADCSMPPDGPDRYRDVCTELLTISARDGHLIELKVYKSPQVKDNAVLMYRIHGWAVGRHEVDGTENVYAAVNSSIVVVSVDYRKAPEHPFPQGLQDSYDGLLWCKENANLLGIDPRKVILSGSSAGANLAAVLALQARDMGDTDIIGQVLHFPPVCHPKLFPRDQYEFGSYAQNLDNVVLSTVKMEKFLDTYVPKVTLDFRHSPLLAESLRGLPLTLIQCAGLDILRDEAFAYASALESSGVEVEIHCYAGLPHCFPAILNALPETKEFYGRYNEFLKRVIEL